MAKLNVTRAEYNYIQNLITRACRGDSNVMDEGKYLEGMLFLFGPELVTKIEAFRQVDVVVHPDAQSLPRHALDPNFIRRVEYDNSI